MKIDKDIKIYLNSININKYSISPVKKGRNNLVYLIKFKNKKYILKKYITKKNTTNDNFKTELKFYKIMKSLKINKVPSLISFNSKLKFIMLSHLPGNQIKRLNQNLIKQIIFFIFEINKIKLNKEIKYQEASDSCFSIYDYILSVDNRINKLKKISKSLNQSSLLYKFTNKKIIPMWSVIRKETYLNAKKMKINIYRKIKKNEFILSPSDFGLHNMIKNRNNVYFYDFEYAGWDDPVKLVMDFNCQPDYDIKNNYKNKMFEIFNNNKSYIVRYNLLIKLNRLKWTCVILNNFVNNKIYDSVNDFKQLTKSINYFNQHLR